MDAHSEWQRLAAGLGVWIWLPVLALLGLFVVIGATPGADCDGVADDLSDGEGLVIAVALMASLGAFAAAVNRVLALLRGPGVAPWQLIAVAVGVAVIAALGAVIDLGSGVDYLWPLAFVGVLATAAALLGLLVAWMLRRKPDDVGLLLPSYLVGAGLFVYPGFALLALAFKSGGFC